MEIPSFLLLKDLEDVSHSHLQVNLKTRKSGWGLHITMFTKRFQASWFKYSKEEGEKKLIVFYIRDGRLDDRGEERKGRGT